MATRRNQGVVSSLRQKENSPFTPGSPVPLELFVGRSDQIQQLMRHARQASSGKQENVFLSGDRGIGKSSLAHFVRELCSKDQNMLGIHVFLGGVTTLEELVRRLFDQLLKETHAESWFKKIRSLFGDFIENVGLFGVSVAFSPPRDQLKGLVREFPTAVKNVFEKIKEEKSGLVIILDDINGLADQPLFANWYKSFVDSVATHHGHFPVLLVLCGLLERRDSLSKLQPSLMRVFRVADVERLSDQEVSQFLQQAFESAGMKVEDQAMDMMMQFSTGLPALMHEIGDATFWADTDGVVNWRDAVQGITAAAEKVGQKYLDPTVYRAIRSERYKAILGKLVTQPAIGSFSKREVETRLNADEKKVFHNFLRKMRELGVIEADSERGPGEYRFVNRIFPVYIHMQSEAPEKR